MKDLAPYGQYLFDHPSSYQIAIIFMGYNGAWRAHSFQPDLPYTLYLPFKSSPYDFYWPLANCDVYLVDTGNSQNFFIKQCVLCFVNHGALNVMYISKDRVINFLRD